MTWAFYRLDEEKLKKYRKVWIELYVNDNTKNPQIHTLPQFLSMSEKDCGVYWLDHITAHVTAHITAHTDQQK